MFLHDSWVTRRPVDTSNPRGLTKVRVPARFDFIGGWTDTPPYYFYHEGAVICAPVELRRFDDHLIGDDNKAITVTVQPASEWTVVENGQVIANNQEHIVINAAKDLLGLALPEVRLTIDNNIPKGSGLGGSGLLAASIYAALRAYYEGVNLDSTKTRELIDAVLVIEQMMTSGGGWQDSIGGILGGMKLVSTKPTVAGYHIDRCDDCCDELSRRTLVVNSNQQRRAAMILCSIRERCLQQERKVLDLMDEVRAAARQGFEQLQAGQIDDFARLYSDTWMKVNEVEDKTSIPLVDELAKISGKELLGAKIGGAGGGGFVVMTFTSEDARNEIAAKIADQIPSSDVYKPTFGGPGLEIEQEEKVSVIKDHDHL